MGRTFLEHINGGLELFSCAKCSTVLTKAEDIISKDYTSDTGPAILFKRAVNLTYKAVQATEMITGRHLIRDAHCKNCDSKLGWFYEFATEEHQIFKEGRVVLECALINEVDSIKEIIF